MQHAATIAEGEPAWLPRLGEYCGGVKVLESGVPLGTPPPRPRTSLVVFLLQCLTYLGPQEGC